MKNVMMFVAMALACFALSGCQRFNAGAGEEVVLVKKPWFIGHGGVDPEPIRTGSSWGAASTSGVVVNVLPQTRVADIPDTMTSDGVPISFHTALTFRVTDSVRLISKFGEKWYDNNLSAAFQALVRQAVRKHGMNETAISTTAIDSIDQEIRQGLLAFIKQKDLPVELITVTVGKANPPDSVKDQRIATATQQQRLQTENQRKLAEDARKDAETSRAAADNAYRLAMSLSPEQFLQLEAIKMQAEACGPEGKATCTFIQGAGVSPVYNLGK